MVDTSYSLVIEATEGGPSGKDRLTDAARLASGVLGTAAAGGERGAAGCEEACVPGACPTPPDPALQRLAAAWETLPEHVRLAVQALADAAD